MFFLSEPLSLSSLLFEPMHNKTYSKICATSKDSAQPGYPHCPNKSVCGSFVPSTASNRHSGSVVERPLCDREVAGSIPGRVIPKTLKMVLAALSLGAQH